MTGALAGAFLTLGSVPSAWASCPSGTELCPNEQQFVDLLAAKGINPTQSPRGLANLGWAVCGDLYNGRTVEFEANRVYAYNVGLGGDGARALVTAAVATMCPDATVLRRPPSPSHKFNVP